MSDLPVEPRRHRLPQWRLSEDGKKRHLGGRWNKERVAEILTESKHTWVSMDDIARVVYGSTCEKNRVNVRKHIPSQRNYMMGTLTPLVTRYGHRGTILEIKLYDSNEAEDRHCLRAELDRLWERRELTTERYRDLCRILALPPPDANA